MQPMTHASTASVPRWLLAALCLAACAAAASAQNLTRFTSRFYEVFTDLPANEVRPIAGHMDLVYAEYGNRFKEFPAKNSQPVRLYVYSTREAYTQGLKKKGIDATGSGGMFFASSQEAGLATFVEGHSSVEMYHLLQHEGFHQFAHLRLGRGLPQWTNEGLAEYFGQSVLVKGKLRMGVAPESRIQGLALAVRSKVVFPFKEMLEMTNEAWNEKLRKGDKRAGLMYDQAWAMTHFLIHGDKGLYTAAFANFIKLTSQGKTGEQAFKEAFGPDATPELFQAAWEKYLQNDWEPDGVSTALARLDFLADGAALLTEKGIMVSSMGELKRELQGRQFRRTRFIDGVITEESAQDHTLFDPPPKDDPRKPTSIEVKPSGKPKVPPSITIKGLSVEIRLTWVVKQGAEPRSVIEFR
ncbi:MAG: DUF1570 domain-containing protein [Phycisphaerales bacterium]